MLYICWFQSIDEPTYLSLDYATSEQMEIFKNLAYASKVDIREDQLPGICEILKNFGVDPKGKLNWKHLIVKCIIIYYL